MPEQNSPHAAGTSHQHESRVRSKRKQHGSKKSRSANVRSISDAVDIKDEDVFFLCDPEGSVPLKKKHGLGLYYHDCRFLNGYEVTLSDKRPIPLMATGRDGYRASLVLANSKVQMPDGGTLRMEEVGVQWERLIDASQKALYDRLTFHNYTLQPIEFTVSFSFSARFEDLFEVRGMPARARGKLHPPEWKDGRLVFGYDGADGLERTTTICFDPAVHKIEGTTAHFEISLQPRESKPLCVSLYLSETAGPPPKPGQRNATPDIGRVGRALKESAERWLQRQADARSSSVLLDKVMERSLRDLHTLRSRLHGQHYFAAGVPWYVTLFGRDSLISSIQMLAYEPEVAEHTLRLLARYQGTKEDEWRDEQPGKIMHELRVGELAHTDKIPQTPYYGTIDATPLFLIALCRHAQWTGDLSLFQDLRENVERALDWITHHGCRGHGKELDGYLAYESHSKQGLSNQGWKDSGDSILNTDGSLAKPPIALAEVQGYLYLAWTGLADLYRRSGNAARAGQLQQQADELRTRFNRDYWLQERAVFAEALQAGGKPCAVVSSNAGQVLWSGIADDDKGRKVVQRLMQDDMFSGWGIRTLSAHEVRYDPIGYHLGTIWPHDNSIIVAGFRNYGGDAESCKVFNGILEAASQFHADRLPEVFAGFRRDTYGVPVHYPVACHPQAWAAGSVPFMLQTLLGLTPQAFDGRLRIVRPLLPDPLRDLEIRGLRVGPARVDLRFERRAGHTAAVKVLQSQGRLEVVPEGAAPW
jgi:glycogen debranching enzyme